jgi:uncharacterized membrane protein YhiD involved in acid resistance
MFSIFKKEQPQPKKSWTSNSAIMVPLIAGVIISLMTLGYNSIASDIEKKADKETLQQMLKTQEVLIQNNQQVNESQNEKLEKILDIVLQQQMQLKMRKEIEKPPVPVSEAITIKEKGITKEQYKFYKSLTPEQQMEYRKMHPEFRIFEE